jgi:transcriptional regulator with XRE-family HTH domain
MKRRLFFKLKRIEKGMSQEDLAYDIYKKTGLDISGSFIGQIERG